MKSIHYIFLSVLSLLGNPTTAQVAPNPDPCIAANTCRPFQATLLTYAFDPMPSSDYSDIQMFTQFDAQPDGFSILNYSALTTEFIPAVYSKYDWSRILAVLIDEPYWSEMRDGNAANPCFDYQRMQKIGVIRNAIRNIAVAVKGFNPSTRVWMNLSEHEVNWMKNPTHPTECIVQLNMPEIDVISLDKYAVHFNQLRPLYDWLWAHRASPYQQLALVPGTHYRQDVDSPDDVAFYLQGYFAYAREQNQVCDVPLGPGGVTGSYDGCRVWLVAGWSSKAFYQEGGVTFIGITSPNAGPMADIWRNAIAVPQIGKRGYPQATILKRISIPAIHKILRN